MSYGDGQGSPIDKYAPGGPQGAWHVRHSGNTAQPLIHVDEKNIRDLLQSTILEDTNDALLAVSCLEHCREFRIEGGEQFCFDVLRARTAIRGQARADYSQVATGIMSPELWRLLNKGAKFKKDDKSKSDGNEL